MEIREDLKTKSLRELLREYAIAYNKQDVDLRAEIEDCINSRFQKKPNEQFKDALLEIEKMDLPKHLKDKLIHVKLCAVEIIDHIDIGQTGSLNMLGQIINEIIDRYKKELELIH